ncbi:MAG: 6-bladed beta-propeller [Cyclobacteriaceae bacterium]|nr:6-bladed beta-propeller [Cyclobacteriaceae bacterium]
MNNLAFLLAIALLFSCDLKKTKFPSSKSENILYFDISQTNRSNETISLSTFTDGINYVFLETSEESILGKILKIIKRNDLIFILSNESIYIFNNSGILINKIKKIGKGPGEYNIIKDFDVNSLGNKIAIQSWNKVLIFSSSGDMINELNHDANFINFIDDNAMVTYQTNINGDKLYSHFFLSFAGDTIARIPNKFTFELKGSPLGLSPNIEYHMYKYKDQVFFSEMMDDTLFKIDEKYHIISHAIFDSKEKRLVPDERAKGVELFNRLNEFSFLTKIFESTRYIHFATQFSMYLYDKKDGLNHRFTSLANDIDDVMDLTHMHEGDDNCFIAVIYPLDLQKRLEELKKNERLNEKAKILADRQVSENDNPIIALIQLKK